MDESAAGAIVASMAAEVPDDYPVWPENWPAQEVFMACSTQWRVIAHMGGASYQGLDYPAVEAAMRMLGMRKKDEVFNGVRVMERAALEVLNAAASR